jgi:hypothetical protein
MLAKYPWNIFGNYSLDVIFQFFGGFVSKPFFNYYFKKFNYIPSTLGEGVVKLLWLGEVLRTSFALYLRTPQYSHGIPELWETLSNPKSGLKYTHTHKKLTIN